MKPYQEVGKTVAKSSDAASGIVSLAFRVVPAPDKLYAAQMLLLLDDVVMEKRTGVATTLGHAIAGADEMLDGWAFSEIETKPDEYFKLVLL